MIHYYLSSVNAKEIKLIESLIDITSNHKTNMLLVGAMARDIVLKEVYKYW